MDYYSMSPEDRERTGIDYDLSACLDNNPQEFVKADIAKVLAVWEGENDGDDWRWILQMNDGSTIYLQGGCDYTGWDCQSSASSTVCETPEIAAAEALTPEKYGYSNNGQEVFANLIMQLETGKDTTWREQQDKNEGL